MLAGSEGWMSPRMIGEAALISVGAFVLGYVVSMVWPKAHKPQLFGVLAAVTMMAALAYVGSKAAMLAIIVCMGTAVLLFLLGVL